MKFTPSTIAILAAMACIGLSGCGKSTSPTGLSPALDSTPPSAPENVGLTTSVTENNLTWAASAAFTLQAAALHAESRK